MSHELAEKIAGEVTLSGKPGQTIKKWREIFDKAGLTIVEEQIYDLIGLR